MKKRIICFFVGMLLCIPMFANGNKETVAELTPTVPVRTDEVIVSVGADVASLSPWASTTQGRMSLLYTLYEYLAYYDSSSETGISGIIMKDYRQLDPYTYRISIYDYVYDHAGNHITANDVAYCFNEYRRLALSGLAHNVVDCSVVDEYTVDLKLATSTAGMLQNIICGQVPIVSQKAYEQSGDNMTNLPISTSPYKVTNYVSGSKIVVERTGNYWQKDTSKILPISQANVSKIVFQIITEPAMVSINLETGAIDIASNMTTNEASRFENKNGFKVECIDGTSIQFLYFNMSDDSVFKNNKTLRQGLCYAIDTQGLVKGVVNGAGTVAKALGNKICVDYNSAWENEPYYEYDLQKAKELIKVSGFDTTKKLSLLVANTAETKAIAQIVQAYLGQVGISVELNVYDSAMFKTLTQDSTSYDLLIDGKMSNDYVTTLSTTMVTLGKNVAINFAEDEYYASLVRAASESATHSAKTVEAYMQYSKDVVYCYALYTPQGFYAYDSLVTDLYVNYKGYVIPGACKYSWN